MDNPKNPRVVTDSINVYKFNPCTSIKCGASYSAVIQIRRIRLENILIFSIIKVCQTVGNKYNFVIGEQDKVELLMISGGSLQFTYLTSNTKYKKNLINKKFYFIFLLYRLTNLKCVCADKEAFMYVSESPKENFVRMRLFF